MCHLTKQIDMKFDGRSDGQTMERRYRTHLSPTQADQHSVMTDIRTDNRQIRKVTNTVTSFVSLYIDGTTTSVTHTNLIKENVWKSNVYMPDRQTDKHTTSYHYEPNLMTDT